MVGRRWFASWREDLLRQGRAIEGGWPGTLPEARALVAASVAPAFTQRRMPILTNEELIWAMRATYDEARRAWLASHERLRGPDLGP
jgi:hypothetical protein